MSRDTEPLLHPEEQADNGGDQDNNQSTRCCALELTVPYYKLVWLLKLTSSLSLFARARCGGACPTEGQQPCQRRGSSVGGYDYLHPTRCGLACHAPLHCTLYCKQPRTLIVLSTATVCQCVQCTHADGGRRAGDMLGLGSLTLPSAFARLGWVFALVLMGLCCAGTLYSGRLFTMLTLQVIACPLARQLLPTLVKMQR